MINPQRREDLAARFGFPLDEFQIRALEAIDAGQSVIVSAPTGSGKTVVAEYGILRALEQRHRVFYTTPIKALSNQKYFDLMEMFGRESVGLLTGDNVVNPDAPIVVMTTEVLRNMLYARSEALSDLATVVLDEVHFIQDEYRGPVWEEVIIHLPQEVKLICLSATVSNTAEVAEWLTTVRGATRYVVEEHRPVELEPMLMVSERSEGVVLLPLFEGGRINPRIQRLIEQIKVRHKGPRGAGRRALTTPHRSDVIERLRTEGLLPVIYFIFSRQGCDDAATTASRELPAVTTDRERLQIRQILEERVRDLSDEDLEVLDFESFRERLESGFVAHHAGMVPPFKEAVEACFSRGLVKVVFATETLAVGINMPARSVVIDKLTKFTGEHHEFLTAAQFTQLTGRAGRRGLDDKGHAILLWNPFVTVEQMAGLASNRSFRLTSSFRPTYNMAVNLVRSYPRDHARHLLNLSLAQFQSDRDVVRLETRLDKKLLELRELELSLHTPYGTPDEYARLAIQEHDGRDRPASDIDKGIAILRPGDIISVGQARYRGFATILSTTRRGAGWKVTAIGANRSLLQLSGDDFSIAPSVVDSIELPSPFTPTRQDFQRKVVERMSRATRRRGSASSKSSPTIEFPVEHPDSQLRLDPDLESRLDIARRAHKLRKEVPFLQKQVDQHASSISRTFDRVLGILETLGYAENWSLTSTGAVLAKLFHESDLLIAEVLTRGLLDGLDASTLAALTSVFVYEHRSSEPAPAPWFPSKLARSRWKAIENLSTELRRLELTNHLVPHRSPDPTYVSVAFSWAAGGDFSDVIEDEDLTGGDFVRNMKQIADLLRQFGIAAPNPTTRVEAARACEMLMRGVVSASSSIPEAI